MVLRCKDHTQFKHLPSTYYVPTQCNKYYRHKVSYDQIFVHQHLMSERLWNGGGVKRTNTQLKYCDVHAVMKAYILGAGHATHSVLSTKVAKK